MSYCSYLMKEYFGVDEIGPVAAAAVKAGVGFGTAILGVGGVACWKNPDKCRDATKGVLNHFSRGSTMKHSDSSSDDANKSNNGSYYAYNSDSNSNSDSDSD